VTGVVGFHHVQVAAPAGCESAARAFYGDLLGLEEIDKPPLLALRGGCWFRAGSADLHVGVEDAFRPATKAHPALLLESTVALEHVAQALTAAGVEILWADETEIPGQRRCHVSDPWGNRLELVAVATEP
jgi:catechol 2,3-dioxygenase-like lactoylglutathione lyase family enzyme